ncbi:unnamed protein product [Acanthoscelides obtectus]|uniref:Uncharacterized protein n=1 Tax=Acanthoscelides obtectus TaxID=200917 RepID=A0A9P0LAD0_ACAOB|nr:unnamed protein product [Acanthoscelides obtectus]CAK1646873.1 hypothetical protein AOBTE_LOCUS14907 [Acanthoscelides obtectus]
MHIYWFYILDA